MGNNGCLVDKMEVLESFYIVFVVLGELFHRGDAEGAKDFFDRIYRIVMIFFVFVRRFC